jgi:tetratricopeptide (TPR) repeat protein
MIKKSNQNIYSIHKSFLLLLIIFSNSLAFGQEEPPEIKTRNDLDENLFFIRLLENQYSNWPIVMPDPYIYAMTLNENRKEARRCLQYILTKNKTLDQDIGKRFGDFLAVLDAYNDFLIEINVIKASGILPIRLNNETHPKSWNKWVILRKTTSATIFEYINKTIKDSNITDDRNENAVRTIDSKAKLIKDKIELSMKNAQETAHACAKKYGWNPTEVGWELSEEQAQIDFKLWTEKNFQEISKIKMLEISLRPRDPFARIVSNLILRNSSKDINVVSEAAKDCYHASELIPSDAFFNDYRKDCLEHAAYCANKARWLEVSQGIEVAGSTKNGRFAVALCRKLLKEVPKDPTGKYHQILASALLSDNQLQEALKYLKEISEILKAEQGYFYTLACIYSRLNMAEDCLKSLEKSLQLGRTRFDWPYKDPDLENIRKSNGTKFDELFTSYKLKHTDLKDQAYLCPRISNIRTDSPAEKLGLEVGDIILSFDGMSMIMCSKDSDILESAFEGSYAKAEVKFWIFRNNQTYEIITKGGDLGFLYKNSTALSYSPKILSIQNGSLAAKVGLEVGDILFKYDETFLVKKKPDSKFQDEFDLAIAASKNKQEVIIKAYRGQTCVKVKVPGNEPLGVVFE